MLICLSLCVQAQDLERSRPLDFHVIEKEVALGAQLAGQVRGQTTPLRLVNVDSYIDKLGYQLAAQMPNPREDWKFSVIRDRVGGATYEPISLPGGWIFVPAQLVLLADNKGEFAGMLAHAMAHVAARQSIRQTPSDGRYQATVPMPLIFLGRPVGFGGDGGNRLVPLGYVKRQQQYELEADDIAVKAIAGVGFDPDALLNYIARTQPQHTKPPEELSPLPPLSVRVPNLRRAVQSVSAPGMPGSADSFRSIQDEVHRQETGASKPNEVYRIPSLIHPDDR